MIEQKPNEQQENCQKCTLNNKTRAYLPTGFIGINPADLQTNDHNSKNKGGLVHIAVFL